MFVIKQNDTLPHLEVQLLDVDDNPINLDLCGVHFHMNERNGGNVIDTPAIILNEIDGQVKYEWQLGDTDKVGIYECEFEINMPDGNIVTVPTDGYFLVGIVKELA